MENENRYLAPEYFMHGIVDEKTDVFAFGVFLLEIISGRKPVDGSHRSLLSWVNVLILLLHNAEFLILISSMNTGKNVSRR